MLSNKEAIYFPRTIDLIVNWERENCEADIIHIHGENDHTIPIRGIYEPIILKNGSHMITLTEADKINKILSVIL
jgi:pimeloyl-ACP methyl ester carboxylesterase